MFAVIGKVRMKAAHRQAIIDALIADGKGSVENEPGCVMFNVVQDHQDENLLHLFEVYNDEAAFEAHKIAPHFVKSFEAIDGLLDGPLNLATGETLYP